MLKRLLQGCREVVSDSLKVITTLFKIMIPAILVVKLLTELGATEWLGQLLTPIMGWMGLPPEAGLIWATSLLTNIYTGVVIFFSTQGTADWTLAQVTVLGVLLLSAHNLPVEIRVAQKAGCRVLPQLLLRIGGGILLGTILHHGYRLSDSLQTTQELPWQPQPAGGGWLEWGLSQLQTLFWTALMILLLMTSLRLLRLLGIERLIEWALRPLLKLIGIAPNALSITLIGMTLGLAYGGGLLIREAEKGDIEPADVFCAISLLGLCHSLIEDTLLVLVMGADLSGILWARLAFALITIAIISRLLPRLPQQHWLYRSVHSPRTEPASH
ncbi:nucleoside recognition domain-containing protein [Marinobacterium sediminicola]|uniref:Nucleoside recognition n=1 Tax=Marinobacterium sediminicola TaxID=518898 RepID=A0ABY1S1I4_9GAMM|nr:nucleoside recognition domain-containing protein [Marinobacterium sediminicola]ULG69361.1 hypothetical protein LN244_00700 [Marinobacterium sediminicola]SMR75508.1 Nucleoside recognition [Marinobacterium sediminicola]